MQFNYDCKILADLINVILPYKLLLVPNITNMLEINGKCMRAQIWGYR